VLATKDYGVKVFSDAARLQKLLGLARTERYSAPKLARIFNCEKKTILGTLSKLGERLPNLGQFKRKYALDDHFFSSLNAVSAYWLGFIAADGCLYSKAGGEKSLYVTLRYSDANHLRKFKKAIKSTARLGYTKSNHSVRLGFYSFGTLFDSLVNLGITPNKSLRIRRVEVVDNLMSHFIRGVFDGDGSISGKKASHVQFEIAGYAPLLKQIQNTLVQECGVNKVRIYPLADGGKGGASRLQYTGAQIFRILDFLYRDSTNQTRLARKYEKYISLKGRFLKACLVN